MPRIIIEAVAQQEMRPPYNDQAHGGDWYFNDSGDLVVRVIGGDVLDDGAFLFALHELAEAMLCRKRAIAQSTIDEFDRGQADADPFSEPGEAEGCPYAREHRQACLIEFLMADYLGVAPYGTIG